MKRVMFVVSGLGWLGIAWHAWGAFQPADAVDAFFRLAAIAACFKVALDQFVQALPAVDGAA